MKDFVIKMWERILKMWERIKWFIRLFQRRYTIHVSYDSQWGNEDDQVWHHVRKIIKANFKELKFRTDNYKTVHIKGMNGLRYKIEDE